MFITLRKWIISWTISCHCSLSIPPENIRKPEIFWCFQGAQKENSDMKWINEVLHTASLFRGVWMRNPAGIYLLKRHIYQLKRHRRPSGVFHVNFEHISHLVLVFLLLTLNMQLPAGKQLFTVRIAKSQWSSSKQ